MECHLAPSESKNDRIEIYLRHHSALWSTPPGSTQVKYLGVTSGTTAHGTSSVATGRSAVCVDVVLVSFTLLVG